MMKQTAFRDECVFEDSKLLGANFDSCNSFMFSALFKRCALAYASFRGFEMKHTRFIDCKLMEADFTDAVLTGSSFEKCDLSNAVFEQTNAEKVDFSTAVNFDIDPSQNKLKKAAFSEAGLIGLLRKYDLIVK